MGGSATLDPNVLVDSLVPDVIDGLRRDLHPQFGVRPYNVTIVKREWSGLMLGEGTFTDTETLIDPQPRIPRWDGYGYQMVPTGLENDGGIKVTEVSLSYTWDELTGGSLEPNEQVFVKVSDATGAGMPDQVFIHAKPPYIDRERDMGWVLWLKPGNIPGCPG
jgi:hypothetical protein